jgi:AcrR family transcriptional regulator
MQKASRPATIDRSPQQRSRAKKKASRDAPVSRDPERTSAAIRSAALKEFAEKGYGGARIDEIARRADANKRSLYYHFGDKEALYLAVLEGAYADIRAAEANLHLSGRDPLDGIRELCRFTWTYYLEHPEFLSLLNTENLMRAKQLKRSARIRNLHSPLVETLRDLLARGARTGLFRKDADPVRVYITIASVGFFYLSNRWTLSTIFGRDLTRSEELTAWGDHLMEVVLGYLRA